MIAVFYVLLLVLAAALGYTAYQSRRFEKDHPNIGTLVDLGGYKINALHIPPPAQADLPPLVFIHGASGNLLDQVGAFLAPLQGRAEMLFVDRPGHGYSERGGPQNDTPAGQADALAQLMDKLGIEKALIVGHSFGGAIAAAFGVRHPAKTQGLLFLAPATHPWPGGVDWYYHLSAAPLVGWLFNHALMMPIGLNRLDQATRNVFAPNRRPENYVQATGPALVLRPKTFAANARDLVRLVDYFRANASFYKQIKKPCVIITGDSDAIVWEHLHSQGLARDIVGSEYVRICGLGHKPDYVATDVAIVALEKIAGLPRDVQDAARRAERRIAEETPQAHQATSAAGLPEPEVTTGAAPSSA